jgi:RNA polymerase sigma-70 factor, ECF subfamily
VSAANLHLMVTPAVGGEPSLEALRAGDRETVRAALAELLPRFEGRSSLGTLAHRITVRVAYRVFEKRRRAGPTLELVASEGDESDPESQAADRETLRRLYRCLDRLPEKRRVAFVLCAIEGLTPGEAAALEGVSSLAMRSRLMHAREEVSRMMGSTSRRTPS